MTKRMMYIDDEGRGTEFTNEQEMIDAIKQDVKPKLPKVNTSQVLHVQEVIARAIAEQGGRLYEDDGEAMRGHVATILAILRLEAK